MFNNSEIERLKAENEKLKVELNLNEIKYQQLEKQFEHKNNELIDRIADAFLGFRKVSELATRNEYGQPEQKIRSIKEFAETQKNYFAQLTLDTKNRTITTNQSNK